MRIRMLIMAIALTLGVTMLPASAFAKGPWQGHGHDNDRHVDHDRDRDHDRDHGRNGGTPPGWSKGKKTGWRGGDQPPGLAKKQNHTAQHRYVHHTDRDHDRDHHHATTSTTTTTTTTNNSRTTQARRWPYKPNPDGTTANGGKPAVFKEDTRK